MIMSVCCLVMCVPCVPSCYNCKLLSPLSRMSEKNLLYLVTARLPAPITFLVEHFASELSPQFAEEYSCLYLCFPCFLNICISICIYIFTGRPITLLVEYFAPYCPRNLPQSGIARAQQHCRVEAWLEAINN